MDNTENNMPPQGNMGQAPMNNVPQYVPPQKPHSPVTTVIVIILILVAMLAALYFWGQNLTRQSQMTEENTSADQLNSNLSTSNDVSAIEADLTATDVENSDKEMQDVEKEF